MSFTVRFKQSIINVTPTSVERRSGRLAHGYIYKIYKCPVGSASSHLFHFLFAWFREECSEMAERERNVYILENLVNSSRQHLLSVSSPNPAGSHSCQLRGRDLLPSPVADVHDIVQAREKWRDGRYGTYTRHICPTCSSAHWDTSCVPKRPLVH